MMCELEWNRALSVMALTSDADVSMSAFELQQDIAHIVHYSNVINCNKLKFVVKQDVCCRLSLVSCHSISQGSVVHLRCGGIVII